MRKPELLVALLASGNASEKSAMGIPMNNDSAKKWHQLISSASMFVFVALAGRGERLDIGYMRQ